ncbi:MAG: hypothetical protein LBO71_09505 [Prevotellaceae bacterium]|jgi:hypothetical protein|nr:hypothetical protein [Prevotellaceae bacterium]
MIVSTKSLQIVDFEDAKKLEEIGFDWPVTYHYDRLSKEFIRPPLVPKVVSGDELAKRIKRPRCRWPSSGWCQKTAQVSALLNILTTAAQPFTLGFTRSYVALYLGSSRSVAYWFTRRSSPNSWLHFYESNEEKIEAIKQLLDNASVEYRFIRPKEFRIAVNKDSFSRHQDAFKEIHKIRYGFNNQ